MNTWIILNKDLLDILVNFWWTGVVDVLKLKAEGGLADDYDTPPVLFFSCCLLVRFRYMSSTVSKSLS